MSVNLTLAHYGVLKQNSNSTITKYIAEAASGNPMPWIDKRLSVIALTIIMYGVFNLTLSPFVFQECLNNKLSKLFSEKV